jgi:hypothetical protein
MVYEYSNLSPKLCGYDLMKDEMCQSYIMLVRVEFIGSLRSHTHGLSLLIVATVKDS